MPSVSLRAMLTPATPSELPEVAALVNAAYRGESARQGWTHEADFLDGERTDVATLRADLAAKPDAKLLVLRDEPGGELLGCVWLEPADGAGLVSRHAHRSADPAGQAAGSLIARRGRNSSRRKPARFVFA